MRSFSFWYSRETSLLCSLLFFHMKAIIFDMDGVIVDSEGWHDVACRKIFENFGLKFDRECVDSFSGTSIHEFWVHLKDMHGLPQDVEELYQLHVDNVICAMREIVSLDCIDGARELVQKVFLSDKKMALASSSPRILIDTILSELQLTSYFPIRASAQDVSRSKPSPEIYKLVATKLGVSPADCVAIEDSFHGVTAAKAAGMHCVGIRALDKNNQDLSRADVVFHTFSEVDSYLFSR